MNSSQAPFHRFLPTLTEVVSVAELPLQRTLAEPEAKPVARVEEQAILQRLDQLIDQLLGDEQDDMARAVLAPKLTSLKQCLLQEFGAQNSKPA